MALPRPITATIITLNEERNIEEVIRSAQRVCDEVIVVDSLSADRTVELAQAAGAKVVLQPYLGDGPQKQVGVPLAKNDWIFSIDADERFDDNAVAFLETLDLDRTPFARFSIRRKTFVGDKWIKVWYPDRTTRLYHRNKASYEASIGHASVVGGKLGKIDGDLLHYSYRDYADLARRVEKFSARGARQLLAKGGRISPLAPVTHGLARFFRHYLLKGGFREGLDGLNIAVTSAYGVYMKYAIAIEQQRKQKPS